MEFEEYFMLFDELFLYFIFKPIDWMFTLPKLNISRFATCKSGLGPLYDLLRNNKKTHIRICNNNNIKNISLMVFIRVTNIFWYCLTENLFKNISEYINIYCWLWLLHNTISSETRFFLQEKGLTPNRIECIYLIPIISGVKVVCNKNCFIYLKKSKWQNK